MIDDDTEDMVRLVNVDPVCLDIARKTLKAQERPYTTEELLELATEIEENGFY